MSDMPVPLTVDMTARHIDSRVQLRLHGLPWPWGDGCTRLLDLKITRDRQILHVAPPSKPPYETDDDGNYVRDWTDAEQAEIDVQHERAWATWREYGGCVVVQGPKHIDAVFMTDSAVLKMIFAGGEWVVMERHMLPVGTPDEQEREWLRRAKEFSSDLLGLGLLP